LLIWHSKYTTILSKLHFYRLLSLRFFPLGINGKEYRITYISNLFNPTLKLLNIDF